MHGVVFNRLQDLRLKGGAHAERNLSHGKCRVFFKVSMNGAPSLASGDEAYC